MRQSFRLLPRFLLGLTFCAVMAHAVPNLAHAEDDKASPTIKLWRSDQSVIQAEELIRNKKYSEALALLDIAIARNMRNTDAHVASAVAYMGLGNATRANTSITNAIAIDKGYLGAYVVAGEIALVEKNLQQAEYFLGALMVLCQGASCPEYAALQKRIREY